MFELSRWNRLLLVTMCLLSLYVPARMEAQGASSRISGKVQDAAGLAVPGATVTVRSGDVGTKRTVIADRSGEFRVDGLASGGYTIEASGSGLASRHPTRIAVTVGSSFEMTLKIEVPATKQETTVSTRSPMVEGNTTAPTQDRSEASSGTFLPGLTITYLPNRDRDFTQFTSQTAAAVDDPDDLGVSVAGQRSASTANQVDGTSFNDALLGGRRGSENGGVYLPIGVVREFQIVRSGVDSSVGLTGGGLVNVATKSGANRGRGDAYYTVRPGRWNSPNAFGDSMQGSLHSFGFAEAGAIRKNSLFYSAGVQQDFLHTPYSVRFAPQAPGTVIPASLLGQQEQVVEKQTASAGFGRLDWVIDARNTATGSVILNRVRSTDSGDGSSRSLRPRSQSANFGGQSKTVRLGLATVAGTHLFNQAAVAYSNDHRTRTPNSAASELFINGFGSLGGDALGLHRYTSEQWQTIDDVMLARGVSFGGRYAVSPATEYRELNTNGRFDYNSLSDFVSDRPRRFQQTFITGKEPLYSGSVKELALYVSVRAQLQAQLNLSIGLRWAAQWNPQPPPGSALIPNDSAPGRVPSLTSGLPSDVHQWQPRVGLAWAASKTTTLRLSAGVYTAPTPATYFHRIFTDGGAYTSTIDSFFDPGLIALAGGYTSSPKAFASIPVGTTMRRARVAGIDAHFRNAASVQVAASLEQQWKAMFGFIAGYLRASTYGLERQIDQNLAAPVGSLNGNAVFPAIRPDPSTGRFLVEQSAAHSTYEGGFLSIKAALSARSTILANYTFSRAVDDCSSSSPFSPVTAVNPFQLQNENGNSLLDARHVFNLNAIFNLPAGLKLNPLLVARSGLPYTPIIGFDTQSDANDVNDRALVNGSQAARNSQRQPAFSSLDFRVVKDFTLKGEGHHLDLFLDIFNIAGAANKRFDRTGQDIYGDAAQAVYAAGQPLFAPGLTQAGGPRTIQFTARLVGF